MKLSMCIIKHLNTGRSNNFKEHENTRLRNDLSCERVIACSAHAIDWHKSTKLIYLYL